MCRYAIPPAVFLLFIGCAMDVHDYTQALSSCHFLRRKYVPSLECQVTRFVAVPVLDACLLVVAVAVTVASCVLVRPGREIPSERTEADPEIAVAGGRGGLLTATPQA
jgi:hypothetical protein